MAPRAIMLDLFLCSLSYPNSALAVSSCSRTGQHTTWENFVRYDFTDERQIPSPFFSIFHLSLYLSIHPPKTSKPFSHWLKICTYKLCE